MERTTIMSAYVDEWNKGPKRWRYRVQIRLPDGTSKRIQGTPALNTKEAAERTEREHINRLEDAIRNPKAQTKEAAAPRFEAFAKTFLEISAPQNKPSALEAKESILRVHLTPIFGRKPLDRIGFGEIQDYVAIKTKKGLSKKTINNHLTVLRRLLVVAKKRGLVDAVPEIEWLKAIQELLGHATIEMTMRYAHLSPGARRDSARLLDGLPMQKKVAMTIERAARLVPK
jgi:hypothetical protein